MGVRSRSNVKRRRRAATLSAGDGVDLISGLNDDLLLHILDQVPEAENVVRTHALSRRWRGLWTGVSALRFDFNSIRKSCRSDAAAERYLAFVNGALALRAAITQPAFVHDLAISFDISRHETGQLVPLSVEAAQGWIRCALQHAVKSFILKLTLPWRWQLDMDRYNNNIENPVMTLDEMDNYAKIETMHLILGGAKLRFPSSTVVFLSLVDLSLEDIELPAGGCYLLSRLVSSACCPRLHKLHLRHFSFEPYTMEVLRIEANTLLEVSIQSIFELPFLELRTPSLQILHIVDSFHLNGFTVSAPSLVNLKFWVKRPLQINDVHGHLSSVGTLKIQMFSHGETKMNNKDRNDASIHLLQSCRSTRCLEVSFEITETKEQTVDIIKGRIPLIPHVTHLTFHIKLWEPHSTGPGVECLLAQCINIKYLSVQLDYIITMKSISDCDNNACHWRSHEFSLDHLEEVEFKELIGTDCEFQFIQSILSKSSGIQKVTINLQPFQRWRKDRKHAFKLLPPLHGGLWTTCKDDELSYKWRRCYE